MSSTDRLEPNTDCEGRTADHPQWATCCHRKGFRRYSLTECTGDDSCRVPSHWTDPKYSGPHRGPEWAAKRRFPAGDER